MRLDKFICNLGYGSRKQVHEAIKKGFIGVNNLVTYEKDQKIEFGDIVNVGEENIEYKEFIYVILNKPIGYVSSKKAEGGHKSYMELLENCPYAQIINIVGRLDFDTSGLLFLTNDGELTHKIITPKKNIYKKYLVEIEKTLSESDIKSLETGVKIISGTDSYKTKPAIVEKIGEKEIFLSITEGKFHQVKNMLEAVGNKVTNLKRVSIGNLETRELETGKWRYLSDEEILKLKEII